MDGEAKPQRSVWMRLFYELHNIALLSVVAAVLGLLLTFVKELPARNLDGTGCIVLLSFVVWPFVMLAMLGVVKLTIWLLGRILFWALYEAHTLFNLLEPVEQWFIRADRAGTGAIWGYTAILLSAWVALWGSTSLADIRPDMISPGGWFSALLWAFVFTLPFAPVRINWKMSFSIRNREYSVGVTDE